MLIKSERIVQTIKCMDRRIIENDNKLERSTNLYSKEEY